jgi:hypothetical protein
VSGGKQIKQLPLPGRQLGGGITAAFGVEVSLVQMRTDQRSASISTTLARSCCRT